MKFFRHQFSKLLLIAIGFLAGWFVFHSRTDVKNDLVNEVRGGEKYKYISPLLECEADGSNFRQLYIPFEATVKTRIESEVQGGHDIQLSVYFRNLNNGPWFGINENENFAPASLLKVPLMMAYFKKSEGDPNILSDSILYQNAEDLQVDQNIPPKELLQSGSTYKVGDLIRRMIVYSDNEAMRLLMEHFPREKLYQIYSDLGVANPYGKGIDDVISVKDYASFFRILYNASYLDKTNSENALALLAQSAYRDGLVAGVPGNLVVAHKFGERASDQDKYPKQLHDCGIVYYKPYPYLLCVMTRGGENKELSEAIQKVSQITFEEISQDFPEKINFVK